MKDVFQNHRSLFPRLPALALCLVAAGACAVPTEDSGEVASTQADALRVRGAATLFLERALGGHASLSRLSEFSYTAKGSRFIPDEAFVPGGAPLQVNAFT